MTFQELNKLNVEVNDAYEVLQVTKQSVFASIHARHEELHKAMESLAKTMEANTDDDDPINSEPDELSESKEVEHNDIDDEIDFISRELDELLESMNN